MKKKIRFGIVGTNFIVRWVLKGAREDARFEAVAICSRKQETAQTFAEDQGIPYTFTDFEAMVSSDLIDAVYIASPNYCHVSYALAAMRQGKHVLCEKPLASNAQEAQVMIAASEQYGVTLMEAMKPTLTPNFKKVMNQLAKVGTVRRYFSCYCQYSSRYDKLKEGIVLNAFKRELSTGAMMDIGIYTLYPLIVLFGKPDKIDASGYLLSTGVDGQGAINFTYPTMNATILYSKIADSNLPTEIQGESGLLRVDKIQTISDVRFYPRQEAASGKGEKSKPEILSQPSTHDEYYYEVAHFIDLILAGKRESSINSHQNSLWTLEVIDEVRRQIGVIYPADTHKMY